MRHRQGNADRSPAEMPRPSFPSRDLRKQPVPEETRPASRGDPQISFCSAKRTRILTAGLCSTPRKRLGRPLRPEGGTATAGTKRPPSHPSKPETAPRLTQGGSAGPQEASTPPKKDPSGQGRGPGSPVEGLQPRVGHFLREIQADDLGERRKEIKHGCDSCLSLSIDLFRSFKRSFFSLFLLFY